MVGRPGPGDQLVRLGTDAQPGLGHGGAQHPHRLGRVGRFQRIHLGAGLGFGRRLPVEFLQKLFDLLVLVRPGPGNHLVLVRAGAERRVGHGGTEGLDRAGGRSVLQVVRDRLAGQLGRLFNELLDQLGDQLVVLGAGPGDDLRRLGAGAELRVRDRLHQEPGGEHRAARIEPFQGVDSRRGGRLRRSFSIDLLQDTDDLLLIRLPCPGDQLARLGAGAEVGHRHRLTQEHHGLGGRDHLEIVDHRLAGQLGRLLVELLDKLVEKFVVLRRGKGDQPAPISAQRNLRLGNGLLEETQSVVGPLRCHVFQRIDDGPGHFVGRALDVDLLERPLDDLVVLRPGPGDQLVGLRALVERGVGHGLLEDLDCRGGLDDLQRIHHRARGRVGRLFDVDLLEDSLDHHVIGRPGQRGQLLRALVGREARAGHRLFEGLHGAIGADRLQGVDDGPGGRLRRRLDVDLLERAGDDFVLRRASKSDQLLRVFPGAEVGPACHLLEKSRRFLGGNPLQRIDNRLSGELGRLVEHLLDQLRDPLVISRSGPGDQLAGVGVERQGCLGDCVPNEDKRVVRPARLHARQRIGDHFDRRVGRSFHVDLVQGLLDLLMVGRPGPGDQLVRLGPFVEQGIGDGRLEHLDGRARVHPFERVDDRAGGRVGRLLDVDLFEDPLNHLVIGRPGDRRQLLRALVGGERRVGNRLLKGLDRAVGADGLERVHQCLRRQLRHLLGQLLDELGNLLVVLRPGPNDELLRIGADGEVGVGDGVAEESHRVIRETRIHSFQRIHYRDGVFRPFDVDLLERLADQLVVPRPGQRDELIRLGAGRKLGLGHGLSDNLHRRRHGDRFDGVDFGRAGHFLIGRRGGHLVDHFLDDFVVGGAGPNDELLWVGAQGDSGLRDRSPEDLQGAGRSDALQRIDLRTRGGFGRRLDVDLLQHVLDHLMVGRPRPGDQRLRVLAGVEIGLGNGRLEDRHGALRGDRLEAVDHGPEGLLRRRLLDQLLD